MNIPFWTAEGEIDLAQLTGRHFTAEIVGDALAKINRFSGRTSVPWSVAAHSVLVERLCPAGLGPWALLHDAHEIVIGDQTEPALAFIEAAGGATNLEQAVGAAKTRIDRVIGGAWNVAVRSWNPALRHADRMALYAETIVFQNNRPEIFEARDAEAIDRAITILGEMPELADWRDARDLWRARVDFYVAMGGMSPPRES